MSTVASAPEPSASIFANESWLCDASAWPLEPTQMAPESRTIGNSAAANPPASGSSGLARATRLETTTTVTEHLHHPAHRQLVWRNVVPNVRCVATLPRSAVKLLTNVAFC